MFISRFFSLWFHATCVISSSFADKTLSLKVVSVLGLLSFHERSVGRYRYEKHLTGEIDNCERDCKEEMEEKDERWKRWNGVSHLE